MTTGNLERVRRQLGDRYAIDRELGHGGMGTVYLARDLRLDRAVALKVLPPEFASDASLRERFLRETRTSASFSHPNIVPVHAVEESDDLVAFAMGYVEGESLGQRVQRAGPLGVRELVRLLQDVGYALAYAHGRGVVHRDLKPENIMIERATGRALLMDFGIARTIDASPVAAAGLTRVGEVVGTPEFMSPEQASADVIDGRSDLYSLGLVAFFAATGRSAMRDTTAQRILVRQLTEAVPPLAGERPDLPKALIDAVDRCVRKDAAERFASAEALVEAIDQAQLAPPEIPLQIRGFVQEMSTLPLVLLFIGVVVWFIFRNAPEDIQLLDTLIPVIFLLGVALARILQVMSVARQLAVTGFPRADVMRGMRDVFDQQQGLRRDLQRDPEAQRRRRQSIRNALVQLACGILCMSIAYQLRVPNGMGGMQSPTAGVVLVTMGLLLIGVSVVLLARSPFRVPPGERVFRLLWLGPVGGAFVWLGSRRASPQRAPGSPAVGANRSTPHATVLPSQSTPPSSPAQNIPTVPTATSLESRVAALEAWRRDRS